MSLVIPRRRHPRRTRRTKDLPGFGELPRSLALTPDVSRADPEAARISMTPASTPTCPGNGPAHGPDPGAGGWGRWPGHRDGAHAAWSGRRPTRWVRAGDSRVSG